MIDDITVDAYDDDEQLWSFLQAFKDEIVLPADGFVIGEPVKVTAFEYTGNNIGGLMVRCHLNNGSEYLIAVSDVVFSRTSKGARYIAAYRRWLGIEPYPADT